ncbi:MAG: S8 family serine peptidase [Tolypothrix sp. Co-bin9]|nr:S8 family serine peptidase [Tolypothrix sp. Co-bin9]
MNISDRLNAPNDLNPKFEGFFLEMVMPGQKQRVQEIVTEAFGLDWNVEQIGDNLTEFEVTLNKEVLSVKDAWDKSYNLRSQPGVVDAQPLFAVPLSDREDFNQEPEVTRERAIDNQSTDVEWNLKQMRVFEAWSRFFPDPNRPPGHGIIIGLPDTGYTEHPEIITNILVKKGYDFLKNDKDAKDELEAPSGVLLPAPSHGTYTSSLISSPRGAQRNYPSGKGMTGVAPGAKIIPLRVSYSVILVSVLNLAKAIEYAADNGAHVLSISLGSGVFNNRLRSAITYAQKRGLIIVAAAGNFVPYVVWPAAYEEVIAVTGCDVQREIWKGSAQGRQVDVTAPCDKVWCAKAKKKNGEIEYNVEQGTGTSLCTPQVAGIAALWLSYHGRDQLIQRYGAEKIPFIFNQILRDSCEQFPTWKPNKFGAGIVNAEKVLAAPLPDNITRSIIAPAQALEQHPQIDKGRLDTFTHLFDAQLFDSQEKANFIQVAEDNNKLQVCLAKLLQTTETQLPERLKEVGQELAFYFATNPELYQQLAEALSSEQLESNQLKTRSLIESSKPNNLDSVREILLQNVSEVLKTKLG